MNILENATFAVEFTSRGAVKSLRFKDDPSAMNWVVDPEYLLEAGYSDTIDKLFGEWSAVAQGKTINSSDYIPTRIQASENGLTVGFHTEMLEVDLVYTLEEERLRWNITCRNTLDVPISLDGLHVWFPLAYIMFRDENVLRNMQQSCALFAHTGGDFAKFAAIRRSHEAPHLGVYGQEGTTAAFGSFCRYENRFLEQVSPSLDGVVFHRLGLVENGASMPELVATDWIYKENYRSVMLEAGQQLCWEYVFTACQGREDFYRRALELGHPRWSYTPVLTEGGQFEAELELAMGQKVKSLRLVTADRQSAGERRLVAEDITGLVTMNEPQAEGTYQIRYHPHDPGERRLELIMEDGRRDILVWNVLEPIDQMLEKRAEWLCQHSYDEVGQGGRPHAFLPLSNQGESLGKLNFLLMKNKLAAPVAEQVHKAEASAVLDLKNHWFEDGDFTRPRALYGSFYRIFDLDYIAHVFYLLSQMDDTLLKLNSPQTYLQWAAEVMSIRLDPACHAGQREQDETGLSGVFIMYIDDLLTGLKAAGLERWYDKLKGLWERFGERLSQDTRQFAGAVTEHFYDNAGFGPTCETLLHLGLSEEAEKYGQLILANIGFSNDYRGQNPDRWWEALSYMIHSLWGGLVAASSRVAYEHLGNPEYLEASYRATMAVFNCYDWNVSSTPRQLQPGEAASTFSVVAPNLNMPMLSRNRFGQSVFQNADDPLFAALFSSVTGDDWDMGEELVAYLLGFGTTAYVYRAASGKLRCVNGYLSEEQGGIRIKSYAAYPQKIVMLEEGLSLQAKPGKQLREAWLLEGELRLTQSIAK
ncbi:hypothetical protein [Paenibacillus senegalimassiliensis]|uniref:hypothetical protein n=1 Tax=Paenibacillus senegalimassiliensis TaxID=1737426 RepID=UPI00073F60DF|nr:hypothetical protein [Paenibacillus senegalimassiliensis]